MSDWRGAEWEKWGKTDPYFGVISQGHLRADRIDDAARAGFFESGEAEIRATLAEVQSLAGRNIDLGRALDFGCGVGRLAIPLSRVFREVVGVDVSSAMMEEARANCASAGVSNVVFRLSTPDLRHVEGDIDFVHSFIVFQHVAPELGYTIFEALLDRLNPAGCGMLHFTYARRGSAARLMVHRARRSSMLVHRALNVVQRRPVNAPLMAMFEYDLGHLVATLQSRGFDRISGRLTDHGGCLGIMLAFARSQA